MSGFISQNLLEILRSGRNLLAFSHGVDSTALFYILDDLGVKFDLATVDYNKRTQSRDEVASAKKLASKFQKRIFIKSVKLEGGNFESRARAIRYEFFAEICVNFGYENLILAHQLDDLFEWFLMQFGKGAGLNELLGMRAVEKREKFRLIRPLLGVRKSELLEFLKERKISYFIDESNSEFEFKRNEIRAVFSEPFLEKFGKGVAKSFEFLRKDALNLEPEILNFKPNLYLVKNDLNVLRGIDRVCKILGVLMSEAQRSECEKRLNDQSDLVIGGKVAVGYSLNFILITPFVKSVMHKRFKESCRALKIPPINRGYIYENGAILDVISAYFNP